MLINAVFSDGMKAWLVIDDAVVNIVLEPRIKGGAPR